MSEQNKFSKNMTIQIGGFFAMAAGMIPVIVATQYVFKYVLKYSPMLPYPGNQIERHPISIFPLSLKIIGLVFCIALFLIFLFRGGKFRKAAFENYTNSNFYNFTLYTFLQGMFLALFSGFLGYTLVSTFFPTFLTGVTP